jgi:hypothetical protein
MTTAIIDIMLSPTIFAGDYMASEKRSFTYSNGAYKLDLLKGRLINPDIFLAKISKKSTYGIIG